MKAAEVGERFLRFFENRAHVRVPSAPLVYNDPTLLFVNAGMVPFKPYFIGLEPAPWKRAASIQKCVRTLDIEDVGKTTRHGTFFQMNGNFAIADYFKKGAIEYAWDLVTGDQASGGYGFSPDDVWVTVLGPGYHADYPDGDIEARKLWLAQGVPTSRIQNRSLKDNYWNMGVPGPGGPCSEIYIDRGPKFGRDGGPEADEDRYLEIWNLVFQTENLSAVRAKDDFDIAGPLPSRNIDTGMGLERVALLLQGVDNMYEIDQVFPVIERACELSGRKYHANHDDDVRLRVVADHVRSSLMLMTEGIVPGNEGREYVLRRLMRRSIRSMRLLGVDRAVLTELLAVSRDVMQPSYPEIGAKWHRIAELADAEDATFARTLASGTALFDVAVADAKTQGVAALSGDKAFLLHDTYGFPIDLTLEMAAEQGLSVDREGFAKLMQEQRNRSKADAKTKKGALVSTKAYQQLRAAGETPFLGYTDLSVPTTVRGLVLDGQIVTHANPGDTVEIVLAETPFYAEAGGQDSDAGIIKADGRTWQVSDVQAPVPGLVVHTVTLDAPLAVGEAVDAEVDEMARRGARQAHSATHVLHAALLELVGEGAVQAGSYNRPGYLRFDFAASSGLSPQQVGEIEQRCNIALRDDLAVTSSIMKLEDAKALGAQAMFGEKYPPMVRVIDMGQGWSLELCGGTHVGSSSQIGLITLLSESSIGAGTRRIEALVSTDAFAHLAAERALVNQIGALLHVPPEQAAERVAKLIGDLKAAHKTIGTIEAARATASADSYVRDAINVEGVAFAPAQAPGLTTDQARQLALTVRDKFGSRAGVVAIIGGEPDKPGLVVAATSSAQARGLKAGSLVRVGAGVLGGKGGGKDDLAQGGGTNGDAASAALTAIEAAIRQNVVG
ncbi:MAG: alanine--tRNA ligase [Propionibacteriaceae bacterium]|nr:alanine--tRNA ligase [Propionibacteriaceae bacterium]